MSSKEMKRPVSFSKEGLLPDSGFFFLSSFTHFFLMCKGGKFEFVILIDGGDITRLNHEIRVYTEVLTEIGKFLSNKRNQRARYLLNVPDLIYHDRQHSQGKVDNF